MVESRFARANITSRLHFKKLFNIIIMYLNFIELNTFGGESCTVVNMMVIFKYILNLPPISINACMWCGLATLMHFWPYNIKI